ncbi:MAG: HrcA family transcriptional regulator, partial [Pseudolysinimonas sp.]
DTGRVDQRLLDVATPLDDNAVAELRERLNTELGGLGLADAAAKLPALTAAFPRERAELIATIAASIGEQVAANRQDRLVVAGSANLARTERDFSGSIYPVLEALEEQVTMLKLFGEMQIEVDDVRTSIGREHEASGLSETSVVATGYTASGGGLAHLGVLGPTRMDYSSNMTAVRAVARYLTRLLGEDDRG